MVSVGRPSFSRPRTSPVLSMVRNGICVSFTWSQCTNRRLVAVKSAAPAIRSKKATDMCSREMAGIEGCSRYAVSCASSAATKFGAGAVWNRQNNVGSQAVTETKAAGGDTCLVARQNEI